jgi:hypothetical protein
VCEGGEEEGYGRETLTEKKEQRGRVKDEETKKGSTPKRKVHPHTKFFSNVYLFCVQMLSKLFQSRPALILDGQRQPEPAVEGGMRQLILSLLLSLRVKAWDAQLWSPQRPTLWRTHC